MYLLGPPILLSSHRLFVLRHLIIELLPCGRKLSKLVSDHLLRDHELDIILSIMNLKPLSDERGNNSARSNVGSDRQWLFSRLQVRQVLKGVGDDERSLPDGTLQ